MTTLQRQIARCIKASWYLWRSVIYARLICSRTVANSRTTLGPPRFVGVQDVKDVEKQLGIGVHSWRLESGPTYPNAITTTPLHFGTSWGSFGVFSAPFVHCAPLRCGQIGVSRNQRQVTLGRGGRPQKRWLRLRLPNIALRDRTTESRIDLGVSGPEYRLAWQRSLKCVYEFPNAAHAALQRGIPEISSE